MKRYAILMAVVFAFVLAGSANAGMKIGPKVGVAMTSLTDDLSELDSKMGLGFGAFLNIGLGEGAPISIQPEVIYVGKGGKYDEEGVDVKYNFDYIEIPILVKYNVPVQGTLTPNLFAGPVIGILSSAKIKAEFEGEEEEMDIKDELKSTDFGLAIGGGVDIMLEGTGTLMFDVRYVMGLSNIADTEEGEDFETKNTSIMFNVGFGFDI